MAISGVSHPTFSASAPVGGTQPALRVVPQSKAHDLPKKDSDKDVDYYQSSRLGHDAANEPASDDVQDGDNSDQSAKNIEDQPAPSARDTLTPEQLQVITELQLRDREVRAHEAAHKAAGGAHVGGASYTYQQGPDGRQYAIGGEVSVNMSTTGSDPRSTIAKMEQIRAAALAPADPSQQDLAVAAAASAIAEQARATLRNQGDAQRAATEVKKQSADEQIAKEKISSETSEPENKTTLGEPIIELLGRVESDNQFLSDGFKAAQQVIDLLGDVDPKKDQALAAYEAAQQLPYLSGLNLVG